MLNFSVVNTVWFCNGVWWSQRRQGYATETTEYHGLVMFTTSIATQCDSIMLCFLISMIFLTWKIFIYQMNHISVILSVSLFPPVWVKEKNVIY